MNFLEAVLFVTVIGIPWLNGMIDFYMAQRFVKENGGDKSAFYTNWIAFKWSWVTQAMHIGKMVPFLLKDLTVIYGVRPDDKG